MKDIDFNAPSDNIAEIAGAEVLKDAEQIKEEATEEGRNRLAELNKKKAIANMKKKENDLVRLKEEIKYFEEQGNITLDGGITHKDMDEHSAGRSLSQKEILFCKFYAATGSVERALTLAGLTNKAKNIVSRPDIRAYLAELTDLRLKKLGYDRNTVIENLAIIANQDIRDYMSITKTSVTTAAGATYTRTDVDLKDLDEIDTEYLKDEYGDYILDQSGNKIKISSGKTKAIKSIKYNDNGKVIMEFHDKLTALKQLANMLDMESPQKITLNDETHRANVEKQLLDKLRAFSDNVEEEKVENKNDIDTSKTLELEVDTPEAKE